MGTPSADIRETKVWRRSRGAHPTPRPAVSVIWVAIQVDVIPAQFPGLLGADAGPEAQDNVSVQARLADRVEQRERLFQDERAARPTDLALGAIDQGGHIPADQIVGLGIPDGPGEGSLGELQVPGRHPAAERLEAPAHIAGCQLPESLRAMCSSSGFSASR